LGDCFWNAPAAQLFL